MEDARVDDRREFPPQLDVFAELVKLVRLEHVKVELEAERSCWGEVGWGAVEWGGGETKGGQGSTEARE